MTLELQTNIIHCGNAITVLKTFPDKSIHCIVTSPPYYGLRDYGTGKWQGGDPACSHKRDEKNNNPDWNIQTRGKVDLGTGDSIFKSICKKCGATRIDEQIGLEDSPELYVAKLVEVFNECRRVLRDDGTLWLNIGDSYWGGKGRSGSQSPSKAAERKQSGLALTNKNQQLGGEGITRPTDGKHDSIKSKDLIGIPWMVAFALRSAGWYLRQDIIWHKPNPMPESVTDRCTKSHEYIFLLSKSAKYFYDADAIKTLIKDSTLQRLKQNVHLQKGSDRVPGKTNGSMKAIGSAQQDSTANKKSVWVVPTKPFKDEHFATFPEELIVDMIKAGCPEGGIVLDPFIGAGTTALVSSKLNRKYIGIELKQNNVKISTKRLHKNLGLFYNANN